MNLSKKHTCSSNTVKLYKHLGRLSLLQTGTVSPIMIHMMPTHRCQLNCVYCCFKNRENKTLDMPLSVIKQGCDQFRRLGTRAIEITGGGDPTLYPQINELLPMLKKMGYHIGVNTNAVDSQLVDDWSACDWVRVSMNALDYKDGLNIEPIRKSGTKISACYIWNSLSTMDTLLKVAEICNRDKIVCRIAPDCIKPLGEIDNDLEFLKVIFSTYNEMKNSEYLFLSDFNITTERHSLDCRIHMIKPCFYTDGYIYPCPSVELAIENDAQMPESFRVCAFYEVYDFYRSKKALEPVERPCSYCKYSKQQVVLEEVLTKTEDNEFA